MKILSLCAVLAVTSAAVASDRDRDSFTLPRSDAGQKFTLQRQFCDREMLLCMVNAPQASEEKNMAREYIHIKCKQEWFKCMDKFAA